jgi:hypothetical protein
MCSHATRPSAPPWRPTRLHASLILFSSASRSRRVAPAHLIEFGAAVAERHDDSESVPPGHKWRELEQVSVLLVRGAELRSVLSRPGRRWGTWMWSS